MGRLGSGPRVTSRLGSGVRVSSMQFSFKTFQMFVLTAGGVSYVGGKIVREYVRVEMSDTVGC